MRWCRSKEFLNGPRFDVTICSWSIIFDSRYARRGSAPVEEKLVSVTVPSSCTKGRWHIALSLLRVGYLGHTRYTRRYVGTQKKRNQCSFSWRCGGSSKIWLCAATAVAKCLFYSAPAYSEREGAEEKIDMIRHVRAELDCAPFPEKC